MNRFDTPYQWIIQARANQKLAVMVLGAGGTGCEVMDQLFRMHLTLLGLGHPGLYVVLADGDQVSPYNVGRQRFWPYDVGRNKAEVIIDRYVQYGGVEWAAAPHYLHPEDILESGPDLLITCVDSGRLRWDIDQYCEQIGYSGAESADTPLLWIDCGNGQFDGQVIMGHLIHCPDDELHLPTVVDLYPSLEHAEDKDEDSCSHADAIQKQDFGINIQIASAAVNLLWRMLRHGTIEHHGAFVDIQSGLVQPMPISTEQWALYGYHTA